MKNQDSVETMAGLHLSKVNKSSEEEALFESLRPNPYTIVLYYLAFIGFGVYLHLSSRVDTEGTLIMGAILIPTIMIYAHRTVNRRMDALYYLMRNKYCLDDET